MKQVIDSFLSVLFLTVFNLAFSQPIIIDHNTSNLVSIPASAIQDAKDMLHIAYGHTSHGSQLITGMNGLIEQSDLIGYKGAIYDWNEGGTGNALDIDDSFVSGDLGHNGDITWANNTRNYLDNSSNSAVNVVIWSWCGGCSDNSHEGIQSYLDEMNLLEGEYPNVKFVYMTGHTDIWNDATLKASNQQIRDYCIANDKILYDFADIERYDPDGSYFEFANDNCDYYDGASNPTLLGNWATEWQDSHTEGVDWYNCSAAHSKPLNGNLKAYAAWWLWCRLAGWEDIVTTDNKPTNTIDILKIFPNPTTEFVYIEGKNISSCELINTEGKSIQRIILTNDKATVNLKDLPKGVYFIKAKIDTRITVKKVIVE